MRTMTELSDEATRTPAPAQASAGKALPVRRRWVLGSVAGAAVLAGVGAALWRERVVAPGGDGVDQAADIWNLKFDAPSGQSLVMASFRGKPLLLNFWATWCPPCVEELPLIEAFYQENLSKSWQVLGIAADQAPAVSTFLKKLPLSFPIALAGMPGIALSRTLGNLSGGLPFTVIFGSDGKVRHRQIGRVTADHLAAWSALK
jgi:thiol-disulfide isomerase/thioredoxin